MFREFNSTLNVFLKGNAMLPMQRSMKTLVPTHRFTGKNKHTLIKLECSTCHYVGSIQTKVLGFTRLLRTLGQATILER